MNWIPPQLQLSRLTTDELATTLRGSKPLVVLLPVGAIEPHGPHLALETDVVISQAAAVRAASLLCASGLVALIAPAVPYGVTQCAAAFSGAVSVPAATLTSLLASLVESYLKNGVAHVNIVNNHLEPAHDQAVRAAVAEVESKSASVSSPLTRRWARTLSREFKSGACHAGNYETSIMLAAAPQLVRDRERGELPEVPISLSEKLQDGIEDFSAMGLHRAYAGDPASATAEHGAEQLDLLAQMIATQVVEAMEV